jgi:hypothetical protein
LFEQSVGKIVRRAVAAGTVRAFGEMVAELWKDGNSAAAIRLEELWNDLAGTCAFSLFCAYPMSAFKGAKNGTPLMHVCAQHTRVIPAESYGSERTPDERLRAIAVLQQKAASLEAEVTERKQVSGPDLPLEDYGVTGRTLRYVANQATVTARLQGT